MDVTEELLARALEGFYVEVADRGDSAVHGQITDADSVAAALYATLSRMAALRAELDPAEPDAELAAMEVIRDVLDAMDGGDCTVIPRILRWACDRYAVSAP